MGICSLVKGCVAQSPVYVPKMYINQDLKNKYKAKNDGRDK